MKVEFKDNSQKFLDALPEAIERALESIGMIAETHAKENSPVDTGRLRNSISHATSKNEQAAFIGTNVEYAPFVELGTSKQKAHPYLRPAILNHQKEYEELAKQALKG